MTGCRTQVAVGVLIALVVAMGAVGIAAQPATANVTQVTTAPTAETVPIGQQRATQTVSFDVVVANNSSATITADLSQLTATGAKVQVGDVTVTGTDVSRSGGPGSINTTGVHSFTVTDTGTNTAANTASIVITYQYNTTAVSPAAAGRRSLSLQSAGGGLNTAAEVLLRYRTADVTRSPAAADVVYNGTIFYRGEDDPTFIDNDGSSVDESTLQKTGGTDEGALFSTGDTADLALGTYAGGGNEGGGSFEVTVQEPRISTAELRLNGDDVTRVDVRREDAANLTIAAAWNFPEAEHLEVELTDPDGNDITDEVLTGPAVLRADDGEDTVGVDMRGEEAGEYRIDFSGNDGTASESYTVEVIEEGEISLSLAAENTTQGAIVGYEVTGGVNNEYHLVTVEADALRETRDPQAQPFRRVEDTTAVGYATDDGRTSKTAGRGVVNATTADVAYAVVQIDDTTAAGQIDTSVLADTTVDVDVYTAADKNGFYDPTAANVSVRDEASIDVQEPQIRLTQPADQYVINQEATLQGTAPGVDAVRVYARDSGAWQPVAIDGDQTITVSDTDRFGEADVVLTDGDRAGNTLLALPGDYQLGVIAADAVTPPLTAGTGTRGSIPQTAFRTQPSDTTRLRVQPGSLTATAETHDGAVATADNHLTVRGTTAADTVVIALVDSRGNTVARSVSVTGETFTEEDIPLTSLTQGPVTAHVISPGRDEQIGDGTPLPDGTAPTAANLTTYLAQNTTGSGTQVRERLAAVTTELTASDDQQSITQFQYTDTRVALTTVGESEITASTSTVQREAPLRITGVTNRDPDNAAITITVESTAGETVTTARTTAWTANGTYTVDVEPAPAVGAYIVEATDGETADRVAVQLTSQQSPQLSNNSSESALEALAGQVNNSSTTAPGDTSASGNPGETEPVASQPANQSETGESVTNQSNATASSTSATDSQEATTDQIPGFGSLIAALAIGIVAVGAAWRHATGRE